MNPDSKDHPYHRFTANDLEALNRRQLIEWLCWNDPNGTYTDMGCDLEDMAPLTRQEALDLAQHQLEPR